MSQPLCIPSTALGGALTIGNFDGVHLGHQQIVRQLRQLAQQIGGPSVVFTFSPPPAVLLRPDQAPLPLTTFEQRAKLLRDLGVDEVVIYPTTRELLQWSDRDFFQQVVCDQLRARAMVEGENFRFGRDRCGDVQVLTQLCHAAQMPFHVVPPVWVETVAPPQETTGTPASPSISSPPLPAAVVVSSSRVRQLLMQGDVETATLLLGRPHQLAGRVVHGEHRGTALGFPTANLSDVTVLTPAPGVYAGTARLGNQTYRAAIHLGPNPTFHQPTRKLEVHLLDFSDNLYDQKLEITFVRRLRAVQTFPSVDRLICQLQRDRDTVRQVIVDAAIVD